jgi:archaellum component FlaF (FlaF/FlaG flagellin family)
MKKTKKESKTLKSTSKQTTQKQEKSKNKAKINKKVVIPVSILLIVILIATVIVYAFVGKENSTVIQATKTTANAVNLEDNEYMHVEEDASGDKVPVPNGYVGSSVAGENEIDTGYVIYEGEEAVTDSNVADAQKNRNQYVWVPVPDISKFYGTDANGKKWGKIYTFSSSTSSGYDEITGTQPYNWSESNGVMTISSKTNYREPDVVAKYSSSTGYDMDSRLKTLGIGAKTTHEFLNQLEKEFNNMVASVEKYGGFYIGRYETGNINQDTPVIQKGNTNISSQTWYNMYKRCKNIRGANTNVETGMIWGNQWDRTLMWLIETGSKTKEQIADDSTSWGNYYNATFEYVNSSGSTATKNENSSTRIPTGSAEYTKANNIYDLAGNVRDWTMEAYSTYIRVSRGGNYNYVGDYNPAGYRDNDFPTSSSSSYGCRSALYIK